MIITFTDDVGSKGGEYRIEGVDLPAEEVEGASDEEPVHGLGAVAAHGENQQRHQR